MGQGAGFYVGEADDILKSPLDYRANMVFHFSNGRALYVVDCHNFQNQVVIEWKSRKDRIFDINKGPDLYNDCVKIEQHILLMMDKHQSYFEVSVLHLLTFK